QHLAVPKNIRRAPVESAPVDAQTQVAFALSGKSANLGSIKRQVVPALDQEFLVVVQHVQPAFQVAEKDGHSLNTLLIRKVLDSLFLNPVYGNALQPLLFCLQIQFFE